ncbi:MAG TPA: hypothetical protein VF699_09540 [Caulobacteraceae bacterium]
MKLEPAFLVAVTAAALAGCGSVEIKKAEPKLPDGVERQAEAYDRAKEMEALCRSRGSVAKRESDSDGSRAGDYACERRKPTEK